jgi:hypothetical protein
VCRAQIDHLRRARRRAAACGTGQPAAVIELDEVRVVPISAVDDEYARAEGRGYADAAEWRRAHEDFFRREGAAEFLGATRWSTRARLLSLSGSV